MQRESSALDALVEVVRAADARRGPVGRSIDAARRLEQGELLAVLQSHQLTALWHHAVQEAGLQDALSGPLRQELRDRALRATALQLAHEAGLRQACDALEAAGVQHVLFKGAQLAREIYDDRLHRPSVDVDLLVGAAQRDAAVRALVRAGFTGVVRAGAISHELMLTRGPVTLDLHWHLLRPGRARRDLTPAVLASRRRLDEMWVPGEDETLLILLLHPALTDHVTARLIRAVDIDRWVRRKAPRWPEIVELLRDTGLATAAWAVLSWTRSWLGTPVPPEALDALRPGRWRARYLQAWLRADPATMYRDHPLLVRAAFSLALQDRPSDVLRATRALARARREAPADAAHLARIVATAAPATVGSGRRAV